MNDKPNIQDILETIPHAQVRMVENVDAKKRDPAGQEVRRRQCDRLPEMAAEGAEEVAKKAAFLIPAHFHCAVMHGRDGGPGGENWDAAQNCQHI